MFLLWWLTDDFYCAANETVEVHQARRHRATTLNWPLLSTLLFCSDLFGKMQLVRMERAGRSNIVLCSVWCKLLSCKLILSGTEKGIISALIAIIVFCNAQWFMKFVPRLQWRTAAGPPFVTAWRGSHGTWLQQPVLDFSLADSEVCRIFCKLVCNKRKAKAICKNNKNMRLNKGQFFYLWTYYVLVVKSASV